MGKHRRPAPTSYEEMFEQYYPTVQRMVRARGIEDVDGVASEIMTRFMERDRLSDFIEGAYFETGVDTPGVPHGIKRSWFSGFLRSFVNKSLLNQMDIQGRGKRYEPVRLEDPVVTESGEQMWKDVYAPLVDAPYSEVDFVQSAVRLIHRLEDTGREAMVALFTAIIRQVDDGVLRLDRNALAECVGVDRSMVNEMVESLGWMLRASETA